MSHVHRQSGRVFASVITLVIIIGLVLTGIAYTFGYVVPVGYMGVRQVIVGPGQGFQNTGLLPGYYGAIPFRSRIHLVPLKLQIIDIEKPSNRSEAGPSQGLEITTADGAYIQLNLSVVARFYREPSSDPKNPHGGPADLVERVSLSPSQWRSQIVSIASDRLNRSLSALHAAQFYDPAPREAALRDAEQAMRSALNPYGIRVERVLLDHYTYVDKKIDAAIFRKNIQSQEEKLNEQASKLSEVRAKLEQVSAEWDAKIESLRVSGQNSSSVLRSEADLYEKEERAKADLEYAKASAEVDKLKAGAISQSAGGEVYVAREMAPLLSSIKGGLVQEGDPYDLEGWLKRLGVTR